MLSRCEREKKLIKQENIKKNKLIKKTETREKIKKPIRKPEKKN